MTAWRLAARSIWITGAFIIIKEFNPEDIRGKFVEGTTYLKRRKESGRKPLSYGAMFVAIVVLLYILHYLITGEFTL